MPVRVPRCLSRQTYKAMYKPVRPPMNTITLTNTIRSKSFVHLIDMEKTHKQKYKSATRPPNTISAITPVLKVAGGASGLMD